MAIIHTIRNSIPWRTVHNLCCSISFIRRLLFPVYKQAIAFGPGDAGYAWSVFRLLMDYLNAKEFRGAKKFMEIGPGRNFGTSLLFFAFEMSRDIQKEDISGILWDVYPNIILAEHTWQKLATELLNSKPPDLQYPEKALHILQEVSNGLCIPKITYVVCPLSELEKKVVDRFDLIYSTVSLEHIWHITQTLQILTQITAPHGWHMHRIDLADHGYRNTNYVRMLEYSSIAYWLMFRFIPGATNRWRAGHYIDFFKHQGFEILLEKRELQSALPRGKKLLDKPYRYLNDPELLTIQLDFVVRKFASSKIN